jgi:hypothetical protein
MRSTGLREVMGSWKIMPISPSHRTPLFAIGLKLEEILALKEHLAARNPAGLLCELKHGKLSRRFPATALSRETDDFTLFEIVGDPIHRADCTTVRLEFASQMSHFQDMVHDAIPCTGRVS